MSHTYHHRYTLYPEADRENLLPLTPSLDPLLLLQLFTIKLGGGPGRGFSKGGLLWTVLLFCRCAAGLGPGPLSNGSSGKYCEWLTALRADQVREVRQSVRWSRFVLAFHASVWAHAGWSGLWVLPLVVSVPSFIGMWLKHFLGITQHCGLRTDVPDFRKSTRSIFTIWSPTVSPLSSR